MLGFTTFVHIYVFFWAFGCQLCTITVFEVGGVHVSQNVYNCTISMHVCIILGSPCTKLCLSLGIVPKLSIQ